MRISGNHMELYELPRQRQPCSVWLNTIPHRGFKVILKYQLLGESSCQSITYVPTAPTPPALLKPNSSGQFFKLYRGIVGFSNFLFWVISKEKSMVFIIRAVCAICASSDRWVQLNSPSKTLKTKYFRIQLYHGIVWKFDQKNWALDSDLELCL